MPGWLDLRRNVGLPRGQAPWGVLFTLLALLIAGWLLQERVAAPDPSELDYSELCQLVQDGKVDRIAIQGQAIEGDFAQAQLVSGHRTKLFRATIPSNDPSFLPLLRDKKVRVRIVASGPSLLVRLILGAVPLGLFLVLGLWLSWRSNEPHPH